MGTRRMQQLLPATWGWATCSRRKEGPSAGARGSLRSMRVRFQLYSQLIVFTEAD